MKPSLPVVHAAGTCPGSGQVSALAPAWILAALLSGGLLGTSAQAAETVGFNRDIRTILSDACFHCHGPDPGTRKAGLRLDTQEGFFAATAKRGPAVVPGDLGKSPLWQRLITTDADEVMPPPEAHKDLTAAQKE
ncbi:MAG: c-type cytochrome domain-containing protein, partial [Verrucomicrobiota bacterium]